MWLVNDISSINFHLGKNSCVTVRLTIMNELISDFENQYQDNVKEHNIVLVCGVHVQNVKDNTLNMLMISPF